MIVITEKKRMEKKIEKAFSIFNGGEGLDHWSYSSTSTPFAKNLIGYTFPQEVRRKFAFRYKANFGNLVNNVVQRMIADVIHKTKTIKITGSEEFFLERFQKAARVFQKSMVAYIFSNQISSYIVETIVVSVLFLATIFLILSGGGVESQYFITALPIIGLYGFVIISWQLNE